MTVYTIDQVVLIFHQTKDAIDALSKRHAEEMKPLSDRAEICKSWLLDYLNREGLENAKTEHGLAYKSTIMSTTVDPDGGWDKLLGYILEQTISRGLDVMESGGDEAQALVAMQAEPALSLFNRAVNKTAVKEMLDRGETPPGVKISSLTQVNVRRA